MSGIKSNAAWSQEVLDLVYSITIDGADLPLEGFAPNLDGVSGWAILLSLWYDVDWELPDSGAEPPEVPYRLQTWCEGYAIHLDEDADPEELPDELGIPDWIAAINSLISWLSKLGGDGGTRNDDSDKEMFPKFGRPWQTYTHWWNFTVSDKNKWFPGSSWSDLADAGNIELDASKVDSAAYFGTSDGMTSANLFQPRGYSRYPKDLNGGYHNWSDKTFKDSRMHDDRADRLPSATKIKTPYMGTGESGAGGFTFNELIAQYQADLTFLKARRDAVKAGLLAHAILIDAEGEDAIEEKMEQIADLQEQIRDGEIEADNEELKNLIASVTPEGLAKRADAVQKLDEMRENGEAGEFAAAMRAQEQCFLMADILNMSKLNIKQKKQYHVDGGSAAHMVHGEIGAMVSKLMLDPAYSAYYFMEPAKLSYLTPSIKIYQVLHEVYKPGTGNPPEVESLNKPIDFQVPFFQHITQHSIEQIMSGQEGRGGAVGLKSFDWTYQGSNPANSRRDIKATLELEVQNFSELVRKRTTQISREGQADITHEWMYADLAIRRSRDHQSAPDCLYSQLKVVVGWGLRETDAEDETLGFTDKEVSAIRNSQMTMFLTIIDHAFDIRDDGTVSFKIDYRAYIEGAFTSPKANILITPDLLESQQEREKAKADLQASLADPAGTCRPEDMAELRKRFTSAIALEKEQAHMALLEALEGPDPEKSRIYVREVEIVDMMAFMDNPFSAMSPNTGASMPDGGTESPDRSTAGYVDNLRGSINFPDADTAEGEEDPSVAKMMESVYTPEEEGKLKINYFFLGDLIHVALSNIGLVDTEDPKRFDKTRLLLGPIEINDFQDPDKKYQINIADVPISVTYFLEWFMQRIQSKQEVVWYIMDFIKDVIKNMVYKTLNDDNCFSGAIRQQANFQNLYLVGSSRDGEEDPIQKLVENGSADSMTSKWKRLFIDEIDPESNDIPILSVDKSDEEIPSTQQYNYILLYAADPQPSNLVGDFEDDLNKGVYHFHIGTNKGLVKRIKFTKTDQPYLREARYMEQGYDSLSQLREPYKLDIEMFGNARIFPGMTVYVNPAGLGYNLGQPADEGSMAWTLGLGGYHMVINAQHSIERGAFNSRINCVWVLRGSAGGETTQADGSETPARNTSNCEPLNNYGTPSNTGT